MKKDLTLREWLVAGVMAFSALMLFISFFLPYLKAPIIDTSVSGIDLLKDGRTSDMLILIFSLISIVILLAAAALLILNIEKIGKNLENFIILAIGATLIIIGLMALILIPHAGYKISAGLIMNFLFSLTGGLATFVPIGYFYLKKK